MGLSARLLTDYKTAETHLAKAHLLAPANGAITNNLALVLLELPEEASRRRAPQFAEINARQNPNNMDIVATLGWVNYRLNRWPEAEKAFTTVMEYANVVNGSDKTTPEMAYYLAHLAKDQNKIPKAMQLLRDSLNNDLPFAYRKPAEEMLAQLTKLEKSRPTKAKAQPASKTSEKASKKEGADEPK